MRPPQAKNGKPEEEEEDADAHETRLSWLFFRCQVSKGSGNNWALFAVTNGIFIYWNI